jgi:hypothetical protein
MTVQEFVFSPFYWIHASIEYLKASKRLRSVEKLSEEGKIPYSEHWKAWEEYLPYYEATWKYFTPMCILIIGCMVVLMVLIAITMGHI